MAWDDATFSHLQELMKINWTSSPPAGARLSNEIWRIFTFLFLFCLVLTYQWYCYIIIFVLLLERQSWLISELFFSNILNLKESEPLLNPKLFIFDPETNGFWASSFQEIPSMTVLVVNLVWYSFNLFPLGIHANQLKLVSVCGVAKIGPVLGDPSMFTKYQVITIFFGGDDWVCHIVQDPPMGVVVTWFQNWNSDGIWGSKVSSGGCCTPPGWRVMKGHEWPFWWLLDIPLLQWG